MKKYAVPAFVSVCVILFILLMFFSVSKYVSAPAAVQNNSVAPMEYEYMLKTYEGKIAVYDAQENTPIEILPIYVDTLPEFDVQRLNSGIEIADYEQLIKYIHDFDS